MCLKFRRASNRRQDRSGHRIKDEKIQAETALSSALRCQNPGEIIRIPKNASVITIMMRTNFGGLAYKAQRQRRQDTRIGISA